MEDVNKQTTLVFMPWSGNETSTGLYSAFLENLDSIEASITKARTMSGRVLVFISHSSNSSELYEISYENNRIVHTPIKTYQGSSYATSEGITQIWNDVKQSAEALNYGMVVGCHGCGWTFKDDWQNYPYNSPRKVKAAEGSLQAEGTRFFGSVSDMRYAIDIPTLRDGIAGAGIKLQYVLFDDCYMANVEVAYELRNVSNFLIGSTSEVMSMGMPYASMWTSLATPTPSYSSAVSSFGTFYTNYPTPSGALSAIDCRKVENLIPLMRMINSRYTLSETERDSVQVLDGFPTPIFYDLADYVGRLCKNGDMLNDFNDQLSSIVIAKNSTDSLYTALTYPGHFFQVRTNCGITISDPSVNPVALRGKEKTAWWKATH